MMIIIIMMMKRITISGSSSKVYKHSTYCR